MDKGKAQNWRWQWKSKNEWQFHNDVPENWTSYSDI